MEISIFEYELEPSNRRFIVRGWSTNDKGMLVTAAIPDDDVEVRNTLDNGEPLKRNVSQILGIRLTKLA